MTDLSNVPLRILESKPELSATSKRTKAGEIWRTPCERDWHPSKAYPLGHERFREDAQVQLAHQVKQWHTPHGQANVDHTGKIGGGGELDMQIRQWATPQAHDVHKGDSERVGRFGTAHGGRNLTDDVQKWSTPCDDDANNTTRESGMFKSLTRDVQNWATPRFEDSQCAGSRVTRGVNDTLYSQTRAWGTPRADEYKGTGPKGTVSQLHRLKKGYLDAQVEEIADGGRKDESLNPDWEEILMGWEIGWTDPAKSCGVFPGWPMGQGYEQFNYEPPRTLPRKLMSGRTARIKMIGNGIVPQAATAAYVKLLHLLLRLP